MDTNNATSTNTSDTQYIYNCDVKTSNVTYHAESSETTDTMWTDDSPAWELEETPAAGGEGAVGEDGAPVEGAPAEEKKPMDYSKLEKCDPPKYTLHWVRPLFLNYGYLYDYRKNYYDDVIDYMDKRNRGIYRETPRAQEWAERTLRTYDRKNWDRSIKKGADMRHITGINHNIGHYSYHTRAYYSLRYQQIL